MPGADLDDPIHVVRNSHPRLDGLDEKIFKAAGVHSHDQPPRAGPPRSGSCETRRVARPPCPLRRLGFRCRHTRIESGPWRRGRSRPRRGGRAGAVPRRIACIFEDGEAGAGNGTRWKQDPDPLAEKRKFARLGTRLMEGCGHESSGAPSEPTGPYLPSLARSVTSKSANHSAAIRRGNASACTSRSSARRSAEEPSVTTSPPKCPTGRACTSAARAASRMATSAVSFTVTR